MALALLRGRVDREGFLKKTASAKGKDEVRGKWQERWFVLKGHTLEYFKKKGDSKPKGIIDLRAAKVDEADETTGMDFTIRVAQSKQVFTYLQCSHQQDRQDWLTALRKGAGYKVSEIRTSQLAPKSQKEAYSSFGILHSLSATAQPNEGVLLIDVHDKKIKLFDHGEIAKVYPNFQITHVTPSTVATKPSQSDVPMYKVTLDLKAENYLTRKIIWSPTSKQAESLANILTQASQGNFAPALEIQNRAPIRTGLVQLQEKDIWKEIFIVLIEEKILLFSSADASVPYRVFDMEDLIVNNSGAAGLTLKRTQGDVNLRFAGTSDRDTWNRGFSMAATSMRQQLEDDIKTAMSEASLNTKIPVHLNETPQIGLKRDKIRWSTADFAAPMRDDEDSFVVSWGNGADGQLGHRTRDSLTRVEVVKALSSKQVRSIAFGNKHAGAVTNKGHVFMWGAGDNYELGLGQNLKQSSSPYLLTSLRSKPIKEIALGETHSLALTVDGQVYSWGSSKHGQLGLGGQDAQHYPQLINALQNKRVVGISCGNDHCAALTNDDNIYVWGKNELGQLGLGNNTICISTPIINKLLPSSCVHVSCGGENTAFITENGRLYICGANDFGQCGQNDVQHRNEPKLVTALENERITSVAVGQYHILAITKEGQPYTWGRTGFNGLQTDQKKPVPLKGLKPIKYCASSRTHSLLIDQSLNMYSFGGENTFGELGNGQPHITGLTEVSFSSTCQVSQVACGNGASLALIRGKPPTNLDNNRKMNPVDINAQVNEAKLPLAAKDLQIDGNVSEIVANKKIGVLLNALEISAADQEMKETQATPETNNNDNNTNEEEKQKKDKKKKKKKGVWRSAIDQQSGKTYYYNKKTRQTVWIKPEEMIEEEKLYGPQ